MKKSLILATAVVIGLLAIQSVNVFSQNDNDTVDCTEEDLIAFIEAGTADFISTDDTPTTEASPEYVYRLGELYMQFALDCGYLPTAQEVETQVDRTLELAPLSFIIAQSSIGSDVAAALSELETVDGDSQNGQLLYNGLQPGLDGNELGCAGCHTGATAGPATEGTYTRVDEIRLALPEFADYTVEQYLVESILHPSAYIVEAYANVQMTGNYGSRLDAQMLADLVAYLESQDQFLESEAEADDVATIDSNDAAGMDADVIALTDAIISDFTGDAARGEALYTGSEPSEVDLVLGCAGCHTGGVVGPATSGTWTRINEERLTLEQFADYSPEQYLVEAILYPNEHIPENWAANLMPLNYGEQMTEQDLADLIAYLRETG